MDGTGRENLSPNYLLIEIDARVAIAASDQANIHPGITAMYKVGLDLSDRENISQFFKQAVANLKAAPGIGLRDKAFKGEL